MKVYSVNFSTKYHAISIQAISGESRRALGYPTSRHEQQASAENIVFPRQIAMFFSRRMTGDWLSLGGDPYGFMASAG